MTTCVCVEPIGVTIAGDDVDVPSTPVPALPSATAHTAAPVSARRFSRKPFDVDTNTYFTLSIVATVGVLWLLEPPCTFATHNRCNVDTFDAVTPVSGLNFVFAELKPACRKSWSQPVSNTTSAATRPRTVNLRRVIMNELLGIVRADERGARRAVRFDENAKVQRSPRGD